MRHFKARPGNPAWAVAARDVSSLSVRLVDLERVWRYAVLPPENWQWNLLGRACVTPKGHASPPAFFF